MTIIANVFRHSNNMLCTMLILIFAVGLCLPPLEEISRRKSNEHNKEIFILRHDKPQYHRSLDQVNHPTIIKWTSKDLDRKNLEVEQITCAGKICDFYDYAFLLPLDSVGAYIFHGITIEFKDMPLPRQPETKLWGLYHEESPKVVPEFMFDEGLRLFNYSSTFSRYSDVPFPLQWISSFSRITNKTYFLQTSEKNSLLSEISPILYIQSSCETFSERDNYVRELMKFIQIDSYGSCLKNRELPVTLKRGYFSKLEADDFLKFVAQYKFVLALENGVCDDYVTEKFWRAIYVGVVPIYFGTPTIKDWMPNENSAILIQDYPRPKLLSEHIDRLMKDDNLYEEYLEHKTKGIIRNEKILKELTARPYQTVESQNFHEFRCFICNKLHNFENEPLNRVINKSHYNCPMPISVLTQKVNPKNPFVSTLNVVKPETEKNFHFIRTFKDNSNIT